MIKKILPFLITIPLLFALPSQAQEMTNKQHKATRYAKKFENRKTSSGERFSQNKYTAAHKTIKLGTYVLVVDTATNKWVVVKVNDRCPRRNIIDLSGVAAEKIGLTWRKGVAKVLVTTLSDDAELIWSQQDKYSDSMPFDLNPTKKTKRESKIDTVDNAIDNPIDNTIDTTQTTIYIYGLEDTQHAETLVCELEPSLSLNSLIINDDDTLRIAIYVKGNVKQIITKLRNKYPQYTISN